MLPLTTQQRSQQLDAERRQKLAKFAIGFTSFGGLLWLLFFLVYGDLTAALATGFASAPAWVALVLFMTGRTRRARYLWLVTMPLTFLVTTVFFGTEINPELIFLAIIGFPFLFFSWDTERRALTLLTVYQFVLALIALSFDRLGDPSWFPVPPPATLVDPATIDWGVRMTVLAVLLLELTYFAFLTQKSARETEQALEDAEAAARSRGEFLANMSHEIRTPMNGLIGMIEVLETMDEDKRHERSIGMIRNSAFSLLRILDDILDASQIDAGKLSVEKTKVELRPLLEGAAQTLQTQADTLGVRLRMLVDPTLPEWIWSDSGRLRQVLLNLLSNAVKYSSERLTGHIGTVYFRTAYCPEGTDICIEISDNGTGMSPEVLNTLFQPFAEGELASRRQVGGTGLGLSITRSLIELMDGRITVDSEEGKGTVVKVYLPLEPADGPKHQPDLTGLTILCLDLMDEEMRKGMREIMGGGGAQLQFISHVEELDTDVLDPDNPPIFMVPTADEAQSAHMQEAVLNRWPDAKIVCFSASRSARYGMQNDNVYLIQIFPMMGTELYRALAQLGGLLKTEDDPTPLDPAADSGKDQLDPDWSPHLLVVEDNEINRMVLSKQLELLGYEHSVTEHGLAGLAAWSSGEFDLVLTDCHMPQMDGFELTKAIRQHEQQEDMPPIPIIAITANALKGEAEKCLAHGMDDYMAKPVELETLRNKLEKHLRMVQNSKHLRGKHLQ